MSAMSGYVQEIEGDVCEEDLITSKMTALTCGEDLAGENVPPREGNELPPKLRKAECFFNWLKGVEDEKFFKVLQLNETDNNTGLSACLHVAETEFESAVYEKCQKVYYLSLIGSNDEANELLENIMDKIDGNRELSDETINAYQYVTRALHLYLLAKQDEMSNWDEFLVELENFEDLSKGSQIAVIRLKYMATLNFRLNRDDPSTINTLVELQPENAIWYYFLYKYLRKARKDRSLRSPPDEKEIASIEKAIELEPENSLYVITGFQNLSDRLRHISWARINEENPFVWGENRFLSVRSIVDYMKDKAREMLENSSETTHIPGYLFCLLAGIFSSYLPRPLLDFELADRCIVKAAEITTDCTTINHRRGLMVWKKSRNLEDAGYYLWQACAFGPKNFGARLDLLHLLLSSPHEQEDNIVSSFYDFMDKGNVWGDTAKATIVFLKGCFLLMVNASEGDVFSSWMDAYSLNSNVNHFIEAMYQGKRYSWNEDYFSLQLCRNVIFGLERSPLEEDDAAYALKISEDISKAFEAAEKAAQRFNSRQNPRGPKGRREGQEGRERQEGQEGRERREGQEWRERREGQEGRERREGQKGRERREGQEWGERREGQEWRERQEGRDRFKGNSDPKTSATKQN